MAKATLTFESEKYKDVRLIRVFGPLDSMTYDQFRNYMDPIISQTRIQIVLDCHGLTYVNSRGVTLLMHYQRITQSGFSFFGIAALRPHILKGIELLGLSKVVRWYPTLEEALQVAIAV